MRLSSLEKVAAVEKPPSTTSAPTGGARGEGKHRRGHVQGQIPVLVHLLQLVGYKDVASCIISGGHRTW